MEMNEWADRRCSYFGMCELNYTNTSSCYCFKHCPWHDWTIPFCSEICFFLPAHSENYGAPSLQIAVPLSSILRCAFSQNNGAPFLQITGPFSPNYSVCVLNLTCTAH